MTQRKARRVVLQRPAETEKTADAGAWAQEWVRGNRSFKTHPIVRLTDDGPDWALNPVPAMRSVTGWTHTAQMTAS
jgi:hypothetical protein